MPRYRFSWNNFDQETVAQLALALGYYYRDGGDQREWLSQKVKRPTESFVFATKQVLEDLRFRRSVAPLHSATPHYKNSGKTGLGDSANVALSSPA